MTTNGQGCARCGARLRHHGRSGTRDWCDPCRRAGPDPRLDLPTGFYRQDRVVAALADYDFGALFRGAGAAAGGPHPTLGELGGRGQHRVSAIERGARRLRDVALVAQAATGLCIPPALLGFGGCATTVGVAGGNRRELVSWVDRRDFVQQAAALALGVAGITALDIDRLTALLPHADPTAFAMWGPPT